MDKLSIIGKIGTILSDLQKQQEFFLKNHESLNDVEVELFSASANYLAEYAKVLKKFPAKHLAKTSAPSSLAVPAQPAEEENEDMGFRLNFEEDQKKIQEIRADNDQDLQVKEEELPETQTAEKETKEEVQPEEPAATRESTTLSETGEPDQWRPSLAESSDLNESSAREAGHGGEEDPGREKDEPAAEPGPAPEPDPIPEPAAKPEESRNLSLNERFQEKKSTLYEQIAPRQQQQSPGAPIPNLGRSIGINERYYFIKTLFQDDKVAFDQTITRIDMCSSLGEALEYVNKSLSGKYNWGRKEEDSRKFYDLIKRRFI